jgi:hypothetical protein
MRGPDRHPDPRARRPRHPGRAGAGDPHTTASRLAESLAAGTGLAPLDPDTLAGLRLQPGETAHADIPAHAERFTGPSGHPTPTSGGLLLLGPLSWVAAALLLNAVLTRRARRRAETTAAGWRDAGPVRLVLTNTRTLIGSGTGWQQLPHADILHTRPDPHHSRLILACGDGTPPLRLTGPHIPAYTAALTWLLHTGTTT